MAKFVWVRCDEDWGEEAIDLHECRLYDLTDHQHRHPETELAYYHDAERDIWIKYDKEMILCESWEWTAAYTKTEPESVAFDMLNHGKPLPRSLDGVRHVASDRERFFAWWTSRRGDAAAKPAPNWDEHRKELRFGPFTCKQFRRRAPKQFPILQAFQNKGWRKTVRFPLSVNTKPIRKQTLAALNKGLNEIRFYSDGGRVAWAPVIPPTTPQKP